MERLTQSLNEPLIESESSEASEQPKDTPTQPTAWEQVLVCLQQHLSAPAFETWVKPLTLKQVDVERSLIELSCPSAFHRGYVRTQFQPDLQEAIAQCYGPTFQLHFDVDTTPKKTPSQEEKPAQQLSVSDQVPTLSNEALYRQGGTVTQTVGGALPGQPLPNRAWTPRSTQCQLNPRYIFDFFVVGQHNHFAHAAAHAIAQSLSQGQPASQYNPFFIYGGVGLGKTHLAQAIAHTLLTNQPGMKIRYVTCEQFTNELIHAIGSKGMDRFRDRYRSVDVLVLDDIQFLEGKERTQEEIFHTFNTLHSAGKQIILTSDRAPKALSRLEDRLRSRFEWGLMADIQAPDIETRVAILKQKMVRDALDQQVELSNEVLLAIAESHPNNIRELEGALNKVLAQAMFSRQIPSLESVQALLGLNVDRRKLTLDDIIQHVAHYYQLEAGDLKGPCRGKQIATARQVCVYLMRTLTDSSFPRLGEVLGGRKHTTVLYAYEKMKQLIEQNVQTGKQVKEIQQLIEKQLTAH